MATTETITTEEYAYTVEYEPAEEGGYVVTVPTLPGCITQGDTLEEAREMAADAIQGYLESLRKDGLPLPVEQQEQKVEPIRETVRVNLKTV